MGPVLAGSTPARRQQGRQALGHPEQGHADGREDDSQDEGREGEGDAHLEGVEPVEADRVRGAAGPVRRQALQNFAARNSKAKSWGAGPAPGWTTDTPVSLMKTPIRDRPPQRITIPVADFCSYGTYPD